MKKEARMKGGQPVHRSKRFDNVFRQHQPVNILLEQNKKNRQFLLLSTAETRGNNWRLGEFRYCLRDNTGDIKAQTTGPRGTADPAAGVRTNDAPW